MNEHEMNRFWKTHLKGAFPDWIPNDYWTSFWSEKLYNITIDDAKRALKAYCETKHYKEPDWSKFREFLAKTGEGQVQKVNTRCMYFLVQCYASHTPVQVGQYRPIAWDVGREQHGEAILKRCEGIRKMYYWNYRADMIDDVVRDAAQLECAKLSRSREMVWLPALNKTFGEARDEFLTCRQYFEGLKIDQSLPQKEQISINSIIPSGVPMDDFEDEVIF